MTLHSSIEKLLRNLEHGPVGYSNQTLFHVSRVSLQSTRCFSSLFHRILEIPGHVGSCMAEDLKFDNFRFAHGSLAEVSGKKATSFLPVG